MGEFENRMAAGNAQDVPRLGNIAATDRLADPVRFGHEVLVVCMQKKLAPFANRE
jgi:hypothetical protein